MNDDREKLRQYNLIWDFAKSYKFTPKKSFPMDTPYLNIIYGFKHRLFDFSKIDAFLSYIKKDNSFYEDFLYITSMVMEDIAYKELSKENLVIEDLRISYAKKIRSKYQVRDPKNMTDQIERAYYGKILGQPIIEGGLFRRIYDEIFSIYTLDTRDLIDDLNGLFEKYFRFDRSAKEKEALDKDLARADKDSEEKKFNKDMPIEYSDDHIDEQFSIGSAEFTGNIYLEEKKIDKNRNLIFLPKGEEAYQSSSDFIEDFYGLPVLSKERLDRLENKVSKGIHANKRLYFTRGKYSTKANARFYEKNRREVFEKNKAYIEANAPINNRSINELSQSIKNSISNYLDYEDVYKNHGQIDSTKAWRVELLHDYNIFSSKEDNEVKKFKVDLLLDGSASQISRQALVANQAYIIEEAMDRLNIPIRVMSFSTLRDYTIFNLFRDYGERENNKEIYNFFASGSNRDGLAFRAIHELIEKDDTSSKNILIVLSDGKPNDLRSNINTIKLLPKDQYVDDNAIKDTAKEVRAIKEDNIDILGVFTGEEEDVDKAKLIYGNDFCRITSLENFSKIVSIFMKNQILQA
ncbi:MAG: hypothetical protein Q4D88_06645 [Anaerococcus sp.]|nr:hypothetical protein [Anaerococcus sp.]